MNFKELFYINEKFTGSFSDRDFGDAVPKMVDMPDDIDYGRVESYVHDKNMVMSYIFDEDGTLTHTAQGTLDDIFKTITPVTPETLAITMKSHPSDPTSFFEYSGVEPIKPPINNYHGTYNIPKEFNMKTFNPYGSFSGIRTSDDWDIN